MSRITSDAQAFLTNTYDVIVVGGGTAGLTVASRLSEDKSLRIGVLEAGLDKSSDPLISSGGGWPQTARDPRNHWGFTSTKQVNLTAEGNEEEKGRTLDLPRGKLLGGCSAINAMIWMRASRAEYDALETTFGNQGWNFDSLMPYFRKSQSHTPQASDIFTESGVVLPIHGTEGPVKTSQNWWYSSLIAPFVETIKSFSFRINPNPDGGNPLGLINVARSLHPKTAKRQDSVTTYLKSAETRSNISVLVGAHARRIVFAEGSGELHATAVEFQVGESQYVIKAAKEVILSAGAYQTPQLLELSGIGQRLILDKFNIEPKLELPVGENLQEHMMVYLNYKLKDEKVLKGTQAGNQEPLLSSGFTVRCVGTDGEEHDANRIAALSVTGNPFLVADLASFSADSETNAEDINSLSTILDNLSSGSISPMTRAQYGLQRHWLSSPQENIADFVFMFACLPGLAGIPSPDGGSVHIASADPLKAPTIDLQCFNDYDLQAFKRAVKFADAVARKEPMASLIDLEPRPTDVEFEEFIKKSSDVIFHPVGTAPMAVRELGGVVDSNLKVYGTKNLRIIDASVFPLQIGAMPQATIYAFAEKAADIMKAALEV